MLFSANLVEVKLAGEIHVENGGLEFAVWVFFQSTKALAKI